MGCTVNKPHDECNDVTHKFQALESERDVLKAEVEKCQTGFVVRGHAFQDACSKYQAEISKLKAELEILKRDKAEVLFGLQECIDQRNHHKTKLEDEERYGRVKQEICEELQIKRDLWKSRAAKYREAILQWKTEGVGARYSRNALTDNERALVEVLKEAEA